MLRVTPQERLALGVTALLLLTGAGARLLAPEPTPPDWQQKDGVPVDTDSTAGRAVRAATEQAVELEEIRTTLLAEGERIDPNTATAEEIDRLPRVGPALARRIVERRRSHGPYRSLADFDSVPGVGPALLAQAAPHLALPSAPAAGGSVRAAESGAMGRPLDLNRATEAELEALPGIGPALAARVVAWREANGGFRSLAQLEEVPGIGPALRARLAPHLRVGP